MNRTLQVAVVALLLTTPCALAQTATAEDTKINRCVPTSTNLCFAENRFRVEATFVAPGHPRAVAHAVPMTSDTGYFWFFQDTNVEVVVKMLDACVLNTNYWVFVGGLTNLQVTLTFTDTSTGIVKTYSNPQGVKFRPIQDTSALDCRE